MNQRKSFKDCAKAQKGRHKRAIRQLLNRNLAFLQSIGLKYKEIILEDIQEETQNNLENFDLNINIKKDYQIITREQALVEKDKILMSDNSYHNFRQNLNLRSK